MLEFLIAAVVAFFAGGFGILVYEIRLHRKAIEEALGDGKQPSPSARTCPACGEKLRREAGCFVCVCGYSQCS